MAGRSRMNKSLSVQEQCKQSLIKLVGTSLNRPLLMMQCFRGVYLIDSLAADKQLTFTQNQPIIIIIDVHLNNNNNNNNNLYTGSSLHKK